MSVKYVAIGILVTVLVWTCGSKAVPGNESGIRQVLILGNSIVSHAPDTSIGWSGNWGMAASTQENDFVHLLMQRIHERDKNVFIQFANIAEFERDFDTYDLTQLAKFRDPDLLIIKLSENVDTTMAAESDFVKYYNRLINYIAPNRLTKKIIVDGFWPSRVNDMISDYAIENGLPLVVIHDLYFDSINTAQGLFDHSGVASHPSDRGMKQISDRIWGVISNYFD